MTVIEPASAGVIAETAPTTGFPRVCGAIALPLAFVCQLVCNSLYAWTSTSSGPGDQGGAVEAQRFHAAFGGEMGRRGHDGILPL
ncbi:MAG: hypothetical protein JST33_05215 [Actinobacteria bacterium]|nr:hypothetical protein [Actinomycetota bacterium]